MKEIRAHDLHRKWMRSDAVYAREFAALEEEFALAAAMLEALPAQASRKGGLRPG